MLPVSLHVTDAADIIAQPTTVDFGTHYTGTCAHDTVVVRNIGALALNVSGMSVNHPAFSVSAGAFSLAPNESRRIPLSFCAASVGAVGTPRSEQRPDHPRTRSP
jgi:hypothetical protein